MNKIKILIVEDEPKLLKTLEDFLGFQDYLTEKAMTGNEAVAVFKEKKNEIDLVLLDLMLPDISGYTVLKEIRKISEVPVIILSARSAVADQMSGFEKGADDYITKPFSLALVKLHIETVLKRAGIRRDILVYENLQIDKMSQKIYVKDKIIETTKKEFDLLLYFVEHQGVVLDRNKILDAVWGYDYTGDIRTVDTLVKQLRRKLGEECNYIHTVYGVGYIFGENKGEL
nr:response regulator transcription factor [uncultured Blautia sp.]